ncbi:MAG: S-layer family protein, partial [Cyanobacteriota bacterium]
ASSGEGGGSIQVRGRNVTLTDGSQIVANFLGVGKGGNLIVNASESVQLIGTSADDQSSSALGAQASATATGEAGDLTITTRNLLIQDGAIVGTATFGAGKAGDVTVNASDSVQVIGRTADDQFASNLSAQADQNSTGDAGNLTINTQQLLIRDGAQVSASTFGAGKGGNVTVNASDSVQVMGRSADGQVASNLSVQANRNSTGDAGDLTITTGRLLIGHGAEVIADTFGSGKGGNLTVNASDSVQVIGTFADSRFGSNLSADATRNSTGDAGDLTIITGQLLIQDGGRVSADSLGSGKGGNLTVNASDSVQVIGESADGQFASYLSADTLGTGDAGDLTITTSELLIRNGAEVSARTSGSGKGGNLTVNASDSVQVIGTSADGESPSKLTVQTNKSSTGNAGDLRITTGQLLIQDGAFVSASTFGSGKGGNLMVNASDSVQAIGTSADGQLGSYLIAQANPNSTGDAGDLSITTRELLIRDGAQIGASTFGSGKGGNLRVYASDSVQVIGRSADGRLASNLVAGASQNSTGDGGDLTITTSELLIRDGAQVSAGTLSSGKGGSLTVYASDSVQVIGTSADGKFASNLFAGASQNSTGDGGDLTITTSELLIRDGAQVGARTFGSGKGGNLIVNASESVQLSGASGLFVDATAGGTAGNLTMETGQLSVQDGAQVTVSSPRGQAGNLSITANSLFLNRGEITAETAKSGLEGGANITLKVSDVWLMGNESLISATAYGTANGGNINIDTQFFVALPPEGPNGSDIIANASRGNGGRINITTQGLFGIEFRDKLTPFNDITASSEAGLDGEVIVNQPAVDPRQGLTNLPTDVVDATRQIDKRCTPAAADKQSSFIITGRGGLPPSPTDPLQGESVITPDWVTLNSEADNISRVTPPINSTRTAKPLVEAQSWVYGANGEVILTAQAPSVTPHNTWSTSPSCDAVRKGEVVSTQRNAE